MAMFLLTTSENGERAREGEREELFLSIALNQPKSLDYP